MGHQTPQIKKKKSLSVLSSSSTFICFSSNTNECLLCAKYCNVLVKCPWLNKDVIFFSIYFILGYMLSDLHALTYLISKIKIIENILLFPFCKLGNGDSASLITFPQVI